MFESLSKVIAKLNIFSRLAKTLIGFHLFQHGETRGDGSGGTGEGLAKYGAGGVEGFPIQGCANLCDFAYGHNISELIQAEMLECKGTTGPRERLHFIENDGYPRFT